VAQATAEPKTNSALRLCHFLMTLHTVAVTGTDKPESVT
jgi:hypothetical protein